MSLAALCAIVATLILLPVIALQVALALGRPLGRFAWGGQHDVLPGRLRTSSWIAAIILIVAVWVAWSRAAFVPPAPGNIVMLVLNWALVVQFALNALSNLISKSPSERNVMTPATIVLFACFLLLAL